MLVMLLIAIRGLRLSSEQAKSSQRICGGGCVASYWQRFNVARNEAPDCGESL